MAEQSTIDEIIKMYENDEFLHNIIEASSTEDEEPISEDGEVPIEGAMVLSSLKKANVELNKISHSNSNDRFSGASWLNKIKEVSAVIVGVGGIGSWTALLVDRLNVNSIKIFDFDKVTLENLSGQLYQRDDIGNTKTESIAYTLYAYGLPVIIETFPEHFSYSKLNAQESIFIFGMDNMRSRINYFEDFKSLYGNSENEKLFIDGRLSPECFQIFSFTNKDKEAMRQYEECYLFTDEEAKNEVCSYKQTSFMAAMIASFIANIVVNYVTNKDNLPVANLPFLTTYDSVTFKLSII